MGTIAQFVNFLADAFYDLRRRPTAWAQVIILHKKESTFSVFTEPLILILGGLGEFSNGMETLDYCLELSQLSSC